MKNNKMKSNTITHISIGYPSVHLILVGMLLSGL